MSLNVGGRSEQSTDWGCQRGEPNSPRGSYVAIPVARTPAVTATGQSTSVPRRRLASLSLGLDSPAAAGR